MKNITTKGVLTRKWSPKYGEHNTEPSLTVPGEAYTIQQLFDRAQAGVPIDQSVRVRSGFYATDADFDTYAFDPGDDIIDIYERTQHAAEVIKEATEAIASSKKTSKKPNDNASDSEATKEVNLENDAEMASTKSKNVSPSG